MWPSQHVSVRHGISGHPCHPGWCKISGAGVKLLGRIQKIFCIGVKKIFRWCESSQNLFFFFFSRAIIFCFRGASCDFREKWWCKKNFQDGVSRHAYSMSATPCNSTCNNNGADLNGLDLGKIPLERNSVCLHCLTFW